MDTDLRHAVILTGVIFTILIAFGVIAIAS
jgi:hypothetical protein